MERAAYEKAKEEGAGRSSSGDKARRAAKQKRCLPNPNRGKGPTALKGVSAQQFFEGTWGK